MIYNEDCDPANLSPGAATDAICQIQALCCMCSIRCNNASPFSLSWNEAVFISCVCVCLSVAVFQCSVLAQSQARDAKCLWLDEAETILAYTLGRFESIPIQSMTTGYFSTALRTSEVKTAGGSGAQLMVAPLRFLHAPIAFLHATFSLCRFAFARGKISDSMTCRISLVSPPSHLSR